MLKQVIGHISLKAFLGLTFLFITTLLISVVYHLPVSWLVSQSNLQEKLSPNIKISSNEGTLWQGSVQLLTPNPVGKISWDLSFWSLITGQVVAQSLWQKEQSHIRSHIQMPLFSDATELNVSEGYGEMSLPLLIKLINNPELNGMPIEGSLRLEDLRLLADLQSEWPSVLTGQLTLNQLSVLGNAFPPITIKPELDSNKITFRVSGQGNAWAISGQVEVFKNRQYNTRLKVTAESEQAMPHWAALLQKQGPLAAVLNDRGRW